MRTILLCLATVGLLSAQTPEITGTWQGPLQAGQQQLRTVLKLERKDGNLGGVLYSIDQNPNPIPLGTVTFQNSK